MGDAVRALDGIRFTTDPEVYDPSDDTELLLRAVRPAAGERFLELGCGAGLVSIRAARLGARVVATDLNPRAVELTRRNAALNGIRLDAIRADLLRGLRPERFDSIAFNPPYLPTQNGDRVPGPLNRAFDGGPDGRNVLERFLASLARDPPGRLWIIVSSLQDTEKVSRRLTDQGFGVTVRATKELSFETLFALELTPALKRVGTP